MGEKEAVSHENRTSYAQAIKGNEAFAERVLRAAGQNSVVRKSPGSRTRFGYSNTPTHD